MSNPIIFNTNSRIGKIAAEADEEFLFDCFVDIQALADLKDVTTPKMILLGSTGAGKTALIRKIEKDCNNANIIQLDEMALSYLGNSDVVQFLLSIDVSLDLFFQALWKHVILIEFIRLKFNVDSEQKSKRVFSQILEQFGSDQRKKRGIEYLRKWESKFWISMDENIREITENLEAGVNAKLGAEVAKFNGSAGYSRTLSMEKKTQLQRVARKFASPDLLTDLAKVTDTLAEQDSKAQPSYILIDRLDENWIDPSIKYPLIRALIECLKSLRRIPDLKVVVALRSDLLEKVIFETKDAGFQSEKYEDYIVRLKWDSTLLKQLVNKRINFLFKRKYNQQNITFEDVFAENVANKGGNFSAILERSLYRPRDIINFVNICLETSEGVAMVSRKSFGQAEKVYSDNRLTAMTEEWQNAITGAGSLLALLKGSREVFHLSELCTSSLLDRLVHNFPEFRSQRKDEFWQMVEEATVKSIDPLILACALIKHLHLMGAIGVKYDPSLPYQFFYQNQKPILSGQLSMETKIRVHKMLHPALGIVR